MVTLVALRVSEASVEISVEGAGLAGESVTVQLQRQMTMDMLTLELSDTVLTQSASGASVQTTATVTALDQFDRPLSPADLQLRVVDRDDGSVVTTSTLVFDAEGQAQSVLTLTPPPGTNQDLRVELVRVTDAETSIDTADLEIVAAEALDVDDNTVFDVTDAVLILRAATNSLPANLPPEVRDRLGGRAEFG